MADYQEYRRRVLHRRWRRRFMAAGLLLLLIMLGAIGLLWKRLHREQRPSGVVQNAILQPVTQDNTWNTVGYAPARQLSIQTRSGGSGTALDFRMAALPENTAVEKSWFNDVTFVGDSLTQGMQLYDEGLPNAMFCAYKGVGPNVIVNGPPAAGQMGRPRCRWKRSPPSSPGLSMFCWARTCWAATRITPAS